jgi:hypothetical protein
LVTLVIESFNFIEWAVMWRLKEVSPMGLLSLLGYGPLSEKKIEKIVKLASNPFAQTDIRMREMHRLLEDGSDQALHGVLKRFSVNASGGIADEDEKKYLEDAVVNKGEAMLVSLRSYIQNEKQLSYALNAYKRIVGDEAATHFFISVLNRHGPESYRATDAKLQLIWMLGGHLSDEEVLVCLLSFLEDHSDDVRWAVIDLLESAVDAQPEGAALIERCATSLGQLLVEEVVSPRILQRAANIMCERGWTVGGDSQELHQDLEGAYFLDKKRYVRRRARPNSLKA